MLIRKTLSKSFGVAQDKDIIRILKNGGVGVLPTDTIYGIVGSALSRKAVSRIYKLRRRNLEKPLIILIGSKEDLRRIGALETSGEKRLLKKFWPGPVSVILPCPSAKFRYLHRGTKSLAVRLPKDRFLRSFLKKTGPLVVPSANIEGQSPAETIMEARRYFGDKVDFYIDGGVCRGKPSTLISLKNGKIKILRREM